MTNKNRKSLLPKSSLVIRFIAGIYLLYLAYGLFTGLDAPDGAPVGVSLGVGALFVVCGLVLVIFNGRDFLQGNYVGGAMDVSETEEDKS